MSNQQFSCRNSIHYRASVIQHELHLTLTYVSPLETCHGLAMERQPAVAATATRSSWMQRKIAQVSTWFQ